MSAIIDMTEISAKHTSAEAAQKVRARHWAEWRLQAYGILAIALAGLALVVLVSTIVVKTASVVYEYYLQLEVPLELDEGDLEAVNDPNPRVRASLAGPLRDGLFASQGGDLERSEARELLSLLSTDAKIELGDAVKADKSLIGSTYTYNALLDDVVQMYIKGLYGTLEDAGTAGALSIEAPAAAATADGEAGAEAADAPGADPNTVVLRLAPQAMSEARNAMRLHDAAEAKRARAEARRNRFAVSETEAAIEAAQTDAERASLEAQLETFQARMDAANAEADRLLRLATNPSADFELDERTPSVLVNVHGGWVKITELTQERALGTVIEPLESRDDAAAGEWQAYLFARPEITRNISDQQVIWLKDYQADGKIVQVFNTRVLTASDSSNAELAGIWGALVGSFWTMIVTFLLAFPIGVMASIYLEEFAPKNAVTDFIEVNINNLAAVPSIVFGLLGITVLISGVKLFGVDLFEGLLRKVTEDPRSTPLAGGVVLALMSLPTIIIASRASIKAVPPSIRDAALGLGASKLQTATHHVLPLAMPGILTGSIIAMAQALGETAPLIIIGMNSFIQEAPGTPVDKGNVLPSLIYLWNNNSERLFDGKTAAAITVLLLFLIAMNALAVLLRKRFERRW